MMRISLLAGALAAMLALPASATEALRSVTIQEAFGYGAPWEACNNVEKVYSWPGAHGALPAGHIGAGTWPTGPFWVQGVEVLNTTNDPNGWAVLGATQPNGDWVSPYVIGAQRAERWHPSGTAFLFPNDGTSWLHLHANCASGKWLLPTITLYFWQEPTS